MTQVDVKIIFSFLTCKKIILIKLILSAQNDILKSNVFLCLLISSLVTLFVVFLK